MATNLAQAELASPFQQAELPGRGLDLSAGVAAIPGAIKAGQAIEQKTEQRAFEDLLATGQEGMVKMSESLVKEGSITPEDAAKLDPANAVFQGQEGQIKWYQGIDKAVKENQAKKQATKRAGLEGEELLEEGVTTGLIGPQKQLQEQETLKRSELIRNILEKRGGAKVEPAISPDETDPIVMQEGIDSLDSEIESLSLVAGDRDIAKMVKNLESQKKGIQSRLREQATEKRSLRSLASREKEAATRAGERFIKDTKPARKTKVQMNVVNEALVELGLPDGISTFDPGNVDIPGAGKFGDKFTRFVTTKAGVKFVANVERLVSQERHELYGAALTDTENANFKKMLGRNFAGNEMQFLAALRAMDRVNKVSLVGSSREEAALKEAERRSAPPPKKEKSGDFTQVGKFKVRVK